MSRQVSCTPAVSANKRLAFFANIAGKPGERFIKFNTEHEPGATHVHDRGALRFQSFERRRCAGDLFTDVRQHALFFEDVQRGDSRRA